jgi:hypothetical protein
VLRSSQREPAVAGEVEVFPSGKLDVSPVTLESSAATGVSEVVNGFASGVVSEVVPGGGFEIDEFTVGVAGIEFDGSAGREAEFDRFVAG